MRRARKLGTATNDSHLKKARVYFPRFAFLFILSCLLNLLLAACTPNTPLPSPTATPVVRPSPQVGNGTGDIKIGLTGPLVGPNSAYGTALRRGVLLALDEVKNNGGIAGRKIVLIERDDQSSPELAKQNFVDLVERERVVAVIGGVNDDVATAQMALANAWRVPWVTPIASDPELFQESNAANSYVFRLAVPVDEQIEFMVNFYLKKNYTQIALVTDNSSYGQAGRTTLLAGLMTAGVTPLADERYYTDSKPDELRPLVTRLKASGAKLLLMWGTNNDISQLRRLCNELNFQPEIAGPDSLALNSFAAGLGTLADGSAMPQTFLPDMSLPRQQDFVNRYKRLFNTTTTLDYPSGVAQAYDATRLLIEAMKQPGAADNRENLRAALKSGVSYEGLIKSYQDAWKSGNPSEPIDRRDLFMAIWRNGKLAKV